MALTAQTNDSSFGVGDVVRVHHAIKEGDKQRVQVFEGIVIAIKGKTAGKSFTVRRIGAQKIGIEQIFPLNSPHIKKVEVVREGTKGVASSKLYYIRHKNPREIEKIYSRARRRTESDKPKKEKAKPKLKKKTKVAAKKTPKKAAAK